MAHRAMLLLAAGAMLAVGTVATAPAAMADTNVTCTTRGLAQLCLKAEAALQDKIVRCTKNETVADASGVVALSAGLTGREAFLKTPDASGSMVCANGTARLRLTSEADVAKNWSIVALEGTVSNVELHVSKEVTGELDMEWAKELVSAEISVGGGGGANDSAAVTVGFSVRKADVSAEMMTYLYADISELSSKISLSLPGRLEYSEEGLPFFNDSSSSDSCVFDKLSSLPELSVPGVPASLRIKEAEIDVCAFRSDTTTPLPFLRLGAELASKNGPGGDVVRVRGIALKGLAASVQASHVSGGDVLWGGSISGSIELFDSVRAEASAEFTNKELKTLKVAVDVQRPAFNISGTVSYTSAACSSANFGEVTLHVPKLGNVNAAGRMAQKDGCGANGVSPEWEVSVATTQPLDIAGVTVSDVAVDLATTVAADNTTSWAGAARGTVSFGEVNNASASIKFDTADGGITEFHAEGNMKVGPVRGAVTVDVADGVMQGTGSFSFEGEGTSSLPTFKASVVHVLSYTAANDSAPQSNGSLPYSNAHMPLWSINGSLTAVEIRSFTLEEVSVSLEGRLRMDDDKTDDPNAVQLTDDQKNGTKGNDTDSIGVAWTGTFSGRATVGPAKMSLEANIEKNKFTQLVGDIAVSTSGVKFDGHVEVVVADKPSCPTVRASGDLELVATQHKFSGSLLYDRCAQAAGDVQFAVQGTAENLGFKGLTLTSVTGELKATVQDGGKLDWSGELQAAANLFGGTSKARVSFAKGALQEVDITSLLMTSNGMLTASFELHYINDCTKSATGSAEVTLRLKGADTLKFKGDVEYNTCTGALSLHGSLQNNWRGPGSVILKQLTIELSSEGRSVNETLSSRSWKGRITAVTLANIAVSVDFSTSTNGTSVEATLTYTDKYVMATATVSSDCRGEGIVALSNLPHNIPSFEVKARFQKSCGKDATQAWELEGRLSNLAIPFFGKVLRIDRALVRVTSDDKGKKAVLVSGLFMSVFELELSFTLPLKASEVRLRGTLRRGGSANSGSFASAWQGGGAAFDSSSTAMPALLQGMEGMALHSVSLEIVFSGQLTLTAQGELFGIPFHAAVGIARGQRGWSFGLAVTAYGKSLRTPKGMPPVIANVLKTLLPSYVRLSFSLRPMTIAGVELRRGLSLAAFLGADSGPVQAVKAIAPKPMRERIDAAESGSTAVTAGLAVIADIVSLTQINVYIQLAGNLPLGTPRVVLKQIALAFVLKLTGPPIFGFNIVMDFTFGSGDKAQTFSASGFIGLSATGTLEIGLGIDSPQPWNRPFGIPGVKVLFPLGIKAGIAPRPYPPFLQPTLFALVGGMQVGTWYGKIAIAVNLDDFAQTALDIKVGGIDIKGMLENIAQCTNCLGPVLGVIADMSLELLHVSFNPNPVQATTIVFPIGSVTVPPGIRAELRHLRLWGVIHVPLAKFEMSAKGITAYMEMAKMDWGPIKITSLDGTKGPSFSMALTPSAQYLKIDGRAEILGKHVEVRLELSDKDVSGHFSLKIGLGLQVDVNIVTEGKPLRPGFKNTITATFQIDILAKVIQFALKFLFELRKRANRAFDVANEKLTAAQRKLDDANRKLDDAKRSASRRIGAARRALDRADRRADSKKSSCRSKWRQCKRGKFWKCPGVPVCWIGYGIVKAALWVARQVLRGAEIVAHALINVAKGVLRGARFVLAAAKRVLNAARSVVNAFFDLANLVGGALANLLRIHSIKFSNELTNTQTEVSLAADITLVGKRKQFSFSATIEFAKIAKSIYNTFRSAVRKLFGSRIPGL